MRPLIAVVSLLVIVFADSALAGDPPGGKGWYQLEDNLLVSVPFEGGTLVITGGTPGFLVGVASNGFLRLRFERGIASSRNGEITVDGGLGEPLTVEVDPITVRAFVRQPLSKLTPPVPGAPVPTEARGVGGQSGATGSLSSGGGVGAVGVKRDTVVTVEDTTTVVRVAAESAVAPPAPPRGGVSVFPPAGAPSGSGGGVTRIIALAEHEAWLAKVLGLWDEIGATCETKGYGPGWISICEPRAA